MVPKPLIIVISFLFFSASAFGQYTYTQKLGGLATVMLPDTPRLAPTQEAQLYTVKYHGVVFMAGTGDVSGEFSLFKEKNVNLIYEGYLGGLLKSTNGKLFYKDNIKIQEHEGCEFGYKAELNGQETYRYNRVVVLDDTLLTCGILSSDSVSKDNPALNYFFRGFKLISNRQIKLNKAARLGHMTGHVIGIAIVLSILVTIGLAFVFIIKRIAYRNKSKLS